MPSAIKRGGRWYAKFRDETGKPVRRRTTAQTKRECEALAHELEADAERRRLGLAPKRVDSGKTLAELCTWWLDNRCSPTSRKHEAQRLAHITDSKVGALPLALVTAAGLEARSPELARDGTLGAGGVNHLRATLRTAYNKGRKAGEWAGPNVAADTEPRKVPKLVCDTLTAAELEHLLPFVPADWRGFFAAAGYNGFRKGECAGFLKADVNLEREEFTVRASYDADTTKGKHADVVPIARALLPYVKAALVSRGPYLFPDTKGRMRKPHCNPERILRSALSAAGLVLGYDHTCRRKSCREAHAGEPHLERQADAAPRSCPRKGCGMRLWPVPVPREIGFHGLRHSCATILLRGRVDIHRVQRILRHASITTTVNTYGHLIADDLREAFDVFTPPAAPQAQQEPVRAEAAALGPTWVQGGQEATEGPEALSANRQGPQEKKWWLGADSNRLPGDYETPALAR